jgi:MtN3 and saliva related transmembrane protein
MNNSDLLGLAAGALTTISFIPQVLKTWRSRSTEDISLAMFSVFSVGVVLWLAYGVSIHSWPIIIANVITLCLSLTILYFKLRGP